MTPWDFCHRRWQICVQELSRSLRDNYFRQLSRRLRDNCLFVSVGKIKVAHSEQIAAGKSVIPGELSLQILSQSINNFRPPELVSLAFDDRTTHLPVKP